jgi:hypothetical protein
MLEVGKIYQFLTDAWHEGKIPEGRRFVKSVKITDWFEEIK